MALKLLQSNIEPLGQFDGLDRDVLTMKGGEVCGFAQVTTPTQPGVFQTGLDEAAYDSYDGYINEAGVLTRPAVSRLFDGTTTLTNATRPLFLSDDGIFRYGTLLGSVVGGTAGLQVNGPNSVTGAVLGPSSATGSGKMTCWHLPGLFGVSLDNVDTAADGLVPTNTALTVGTALTFTNKGLLTPTGSTNHLSGAPTVGHLVEFSTDQSLVTTPSYLVSALNSPSGNVSSVQPRAFTFATLYFAPPAT